MSDLVVFLRARVDEDEAAALAALPGPWQVDPDDPERVVLDPLVDVDADEVATVFALGNCQLRATAVFIACHDPARVLAEVAAKRAIVALHGERDGECMSCAYGGGFSVRYDDHPCDTLRHLAAVYAGHVDYRAEWAPADAWRVEG